MSFNRTIQRYGNTPEPDSRHHRAGQGWDDRIGTPVVQAKNWRFMAFGVLGLSFLSVGGNLWQASQSRVVPYVVEVDKQGSIRAVGPAIQHYNPTDAAYARDLGDFITDVRSLSIDPVVVVHHWDHADAFATDHTKAFLNDYACQIDLDKLIGHRTVSVQITSVVRASENSFEVKWTEQAFAQDTPDRTQHWTAILTYVVQPPTDQATLNVNPLGIYVNGINWSRELNSSDAP